MKFKKNIFIILIGVFSLIVLLIMNISYDPLSRYYYKDENTQKIIKQHLNAEEMEYIVEYSINPSTFLRYIDADNFNIYHVELYESFKNYLYYLNPIQEVDFIETVYPLADMDEVKDYLNEYYFTDLLYWYQYKDSYNNDTTLIANPNDITAYVDDSYSVTNRVPYKIKTIDYINSVDDTPVIINDKMDSNLKAMCDAISTDLNIDDCGGLVVDKSYVSYNQQTDIYNKCKVTYKEQASFYCDYPGHSENQLALALDFADQDQLEFKNTKQYAWLTENAYNFGFIQSYTDDNTEITNKAARYNHFRYVGIDISKKLFESKLSLKELLQK